MVLGVIGVDHPLEPGRNDEALVGRAFGIAEQAAPRQLAVLGMRDAEHLDRTGYAGGAAADDRSVERQRLAAIAEEHARSRLRRSDLAAVVDGDLAGPAIIIIQERAAADARALRLDQRQHRLDRDRRVDCAAAALEDVEPGPRGERIGGDHEWSGVLGSARAGRRRRRRDDCARPQADEGQRHDELADHDHRLAGRVALAIVSAKKRAGE